MHYNSASEIMDEIARTTPTFEGVSFDRIDELGSIQWPCNEQHPEGTPIMHTEEFTRGKGRFMLTAFVPTDERASHSFPLILTTGRILAQYNVGAQTRRTDNIAWHPEDILEIHPHDAEIRGIKDGQIVSITSRVGATTVQGEDFRPYAARRRLHDLPPPGDGCQPHHHENSDWATNCPEYKVTAVQVTPSNHPSEWQDEVEIRERREQAHLAGKKLEPAE